MDAVIVFDMDGVLADVTDSYREAIAQTVHHFTGSRIDRDLIQEYKNRGGWNNDWALSQKIAADLGRPVDLDTVVRAFNAFFLGERGDGLIRNETWIPREGLLDRLGRRYRLSLFTGRMRYEIEITLRRFAPGLVFDPILCADDVTEPKPSPEGLLAIRRATGAAKMWYVGDTVDDARSARAAGVPFIGIAARNQAKRDALIGLFREEEAVVVLENVNDLESVL